MIEPRDHRKGFGWKVDLARDRQTNCSACGAPIYFVPVRNAKTGAVRPHPLSEALSKRDEQGECYMESHFSDCPDAPAFRARKAKE